MSKLQFMGRRQTSHAALQINYCKNWPNNLKPNRYLRWFYANIIVLNASNKNTKKASLNNPKSEMLSLCPHHLSTTAALSRVTAAGSLSITFITLASTSIPIDK